MNHFLVGGYQCPVFLLHFPYPYCICLSFLLCSNQIMSRKVLNFNFRLCLEKEFKSD